MTTHRTCLKIHLCICLYFVFYAHAQDVIVSPHLQAQIKKSQITEFEPYHNWESSILSSLSQKNKNNPDPFKLTKVTIDAVTKFGEKIGFLYMTAEVKNSKHNLPGAAFLRGNSVAMLIFIENPQNNADPWVLLTVQARVPAGVLDMVELPAGMVDSNQSFAGSAAKEITEETGLIFHQNELIDMTALANGPVYLSPGGSDEKMSFFVAQRTLSNKAIEKLFSVKTGNEIENEFITLKLVPYSELWKSTTDAKALCALQLWQSLLSIKLVDWDFEDS